MTAIRHNLGSSFNQMRAIYGAPKGTKKKKKRWEENQNCNAFAFSSFGNVENFLKKLWICLQNFSTLLQNFCVILVGGKNIFQFFCK